mgnify:CR=1 FL=1
MIFRNLIIALTLITFLSCNDDTPNPNKDCNCGTIANDGIDGDCYWLEIRNSCSGNKKIFCFDQDIWMDAYVGENFCVTGETQW